ncbi:MAG: hypothetical protein OEQ53_08075 [Saprospiraceae bacterium]|nr:hypothetical protein [Saprospiraceae bacterium]
MRGITNRKPWIKLLGKIPLGILVLLLCTYYFSPVFSFEKTRPFSGANFFNPYANLPKDKVRANFHAHARAWGGLTNGRTPAKKVVEKYVDLGYDLPGISNYNMLEDRTLNAPIYIPMYEHGLNIGFVHQIVINPGKATLLDYPFYQSRSNRQSTVNRLKESDNLIMIAHPSSRAGYSHDDLRYLTGYELMEIISVQAVSPDHWDAALSSGHPVWGIANDDCHDTTEYDIGLCWNMIYVQDATPSNVLTSLKKGAHFAVKGWQAKDMNELDYITVVNDLYTIKMIHPADSITLISDLGERVAIATETDSISYRIRPSQTYLRAEIFESEPWNDWTKMFFNPVVRSEQSVIPPHQATHRINWLLSCTYWGLLLILQALLIGIIVRW